MLGITRSNEAVNGRPTSSTILCPSVVLDLDAVATDLVRAPMDANPHVGCVSVGNLVVSARGHPDDDVEDTEQRQLRLSESLAQGLESFNDAAIFL